MTSQVSIGQVKRDISDLVNRVAYQGERIILTSRGKPKAAIVSLADYARLQQMAPNTEARLAWLREAQGLTERIRLNRSGQEIDVDALLDAARGERDDSDE